MRSDLLGVRVFELAGVNDRLLRPPAFEIVVAAALLRVPDVHQPSTAGRRTRGLLSARERRCTDRARQWRRRLRCASIAHAATPRAQRAATVETGNEGWTGTRKRAIVPSRAMRPPSDSARGDRRLTPTKTDIWLLAKLTGHTLSEPACFASKSSVLRSGQCAILRSPRNRRDLLDGDVRQVGDRKCETQRGLTLSSEHIAQMGLADFQEYCQIPLTRAGRIHPRLDRGKGSFRASVAHMAQRTP